MAPDTIDVPAGGDFRVRARDGVVWAMRLQSGDVWFKQVSGAPPQPAPASPVKPTEGTALATGAIDVLLPTGELAKLAFSPPPGWMRVPGSKIVFRAPGGSPSLDIRIGYKVSPDPEAALSAAIDRLVAHAPSNIKTERALRTDHGGYILDWTFARDGKVQRDVTCFASRPGALYSVQIHAGPIVDARVADEVVDACKAAALL